MPPSTSTPRTHRRSGSTRSHICSSSPVDDRASCSPRWPTHASSHHADQGSRRSIALYKFYKPILESFEFPDNFCPRPNVLVLTRARCLSCRTTLSRSAYLPWLPLTSTRRRTPHERVF